MSNERLLNLSCNWSSVDELEIKVKDINKNVIYKIKVDINRPDKIAEALEILQKFGVNLEEILESIKQKKRKNYSSFFDY